MPATLSIGHMFASRSYRHCLEAEQLLMDDLRNPETTPGTRAQIARALDCILERKRILRMKPAPKPIDVSGSGRRRERASSLPLAPMSTAAGPAHYGSEPGPTCAPDVMHDAAAADESAPQS